MTGPLWTMPASVRPSPMYRSAGSFGGSARKASRPAATPREPHAATACRVVRAAPSARIVSTSYVVAYPAIPRPFMYFPKDVPRACAKMIDSPSSARAGARTARRKRPVPMHTAEARANASPSSGSKVSVSISGEGFWRLAADDMASSEAPFGNVMRFVEYRGL
eukprot:7388458-Prymnesium_polylepis.1